MKTKVFSRMTDEQLAENGFVNESGMWTRYIHKTDGDEVSIYICKYDRYGSVKGQVLMWAGSVIDSEMEEALPIDIVVELASKGLIYEETDEGMKAKYAEAYRRRLEDWRSYQERMTKEGGWGSMAVLEEKEKQCQLYKRLSQ